MDAERIDSFARSLSDARSRRSTLAIALGGLSALLGLARAETGVGKKKRKKKKKNKQKPPQCNAELNEVACGTECCNSLKGTTCLLSATGNRCCKGINGVCCDTGTKIACHSTLCIPESSTCCLFQGMYVFCAPGHTCGAPECPGVLAP